MRLAYKKKHIRLNLFLGIAWLLFSVGNCFFNDAFRWQDAIFFILPVVYLTIYYFQSRQKYLTINRYYVKENWWFGKKIILADIYAINHFSGRYTLKTKEKSLKIQIELLDPESLSILKEHLYALDVNWEKPWE